jgi:electron transfer flavoprotein beta subunit
MPFNIAVFVKPALNLNLLKIESEGKVNIEETPLAISEYDKNAVEEAIRIKEKYGGKVSAFSILTWGPVQKRISDAEKIAREVLSMGADEFHLVIDDNVVNATTRETAIVACSLIKKIGSFDIYLAGEYSQDTTSSQFASRLATLLGIPVVTFVNKIEIQGEEAIVQRSTEYEIETLRVKLPCVLSVTGEINQPRIPTLRQILQAKNKPLIKYDLKSLGVNLDKKAIKQEYLALQVKRKRIFIEGKNLEEVADKLIDKLLEEGVIKI